MTTTFHMNQNLRHNMLLEIPMSRFARRHPHLHSTEFADSSPYRTSGAMVSSVFKLRTPAELDAQRLNWQHFLCVAHVTLRMRDEIIAHHRLTEREVYPSLWSRDFACKGRSAIVPFGALFSSCYRFSACFARSGRRTRSLQLVSLRRSGEHVPA